jgi:hypothetical protein|tara:strand:+ start:537 stop:710 length:174 start_codon:yes stop_codon:yes gene_type:complete
MSDPMFDFSIGKKDIWIKVFPFWLYIAYYSKTVHIDIGIICVSFGFTVAYDMSVWEE